MNAKTVYENTIQMLKAYDAATENNETEQVLRYPFAYVSSNNFYATAAKQIIAAREELDAASSKAGKSRLSAIKKAVKQSMDNTRLEYCGMYQENDRFCVASNCYFARFRKDYESVPHAEKEAERMELDKLVKGYDWKMIEKPELASVKEYAARVKALEKADGEKRVFEITDGMFVNPEYLELMMQMLPDCELYVIPGHWNKGLYFWSMETGEDGLLLPVAPYTAKVA